MRPIALKLAFAAIVLGASAGAYADPPDVTCTCEANIECPPQPACAPQYPQYAPQYPPQYPAPQYPPYQYAPPQYPAPQYPQQYAPPAERLMPYQPAPPPATMLLRVRPSVAPPAAPPLKVRYSEKIRPRWAMFGAGAGLFLLSWGTPAIAAGVSGFGKLAIPFAGPILLLTDNPHPAGCGECTLMPLLPYVIIDVLAQATGAVVAIIGIATTEKVYSYKPVELTVTPTVTQTFAGLSAMGRF